MTQLKIGDKVAIDRSRCLASGNDWQAFEIIGETATLWRLSDGVEVTNHDVIVGVLGQSTEGGDDAN